MKSHHYYEPTIDTITYICMKTAQIYSLKFLDGCRVMLIHHEVAYSRDYLHEIEILD